MNRLVDNETSARGLLAELLAAPGPFGLDCETVDCDPKHESPVLRARIVCWTVAWRDATGSIQSAFVWAEWTELLRPWLEGDQPKCGANFTAYDMHCFENAGVRVGGVVHDVKHTSRFWYASKDVRHGLKDQARDLLGIEMVEYADLFSRPGRLRDKVYKSTRNSKPRSGPLAGVPTLTCAGTVSQFSHSAKSREWIPLPEFRTGGLYEHRQGELVEYAVRDAVATLQVAERREAQLATRKAKEGTALELYRGTWNPMLIMLSRMERRGITVSAPVCADIEARTTADMDALLPGIREQAGPGFNPGSPDQLREFLQDRLHLQRSPIQGTLHAVKPADRDGTFHTSEAALHWLQLHHPEHNGILDLIRRWRKIRRNYQFARDLPGYTALDGRVHGVMSPEADTGRLSVKLPALQQIPSKNDAYGLRSAFTAAPGYRLIVADFSQLEVYVLGHILIKLFGDDSVARALASGDVYSWLARACWPEATGHLTDAQMKDGPGKKYRRLAKILVLATNYGKTALGLGLSLLDELGEPATESHCHSLLALYFETLPGVPRWQEWIAQYARDYGGVPTLLGRWRPIPLARSNKAWEARRGARQALNSPIQGGAMDVAARAMLGLNSYSGVPGWFHAELAALQADCLLQVHDELVFEVPEANADRALAIIEHGMVNPPGLDLAIPLKVEAKIAITWKEGKA